MFKIFDDLKVESYTQAFYQNFEDGVVTFKQRDELHKIYDVTDIVLSVGSVPENSLKDKLEKLSIEVHVTGDAKKVKPDLKNIEESYTGLNV